MKADDKYIFVDLETTGLNPNQDRICQLGVILPNGEEINRIVNPGVPIPAAVTAIHGIDDQIVKLAPSFEDFAADLIKGLEEASIFVAYNFVFDFQFLQNELFRTVHYELKEEDFTFLDPYKIFRKMFPHSLANAYSFYTGKEIVGAHSAIHDIRATKEVLDKQRELYTELFSKDAKYVEEFTIGDTSIIGKWFAKADDGIRYKQGKYRGELVTPGQETYLKWIYGLEDVTMSEKRYISTIIR